MVVAIVAGAEPAKTVSRATPPAVTWQTVQWSQSPGMPDAGLPACLCRQIGTGLPMATLRLESSACAV